ncbi:MAG TPA: hypothetical protein VFE04_07200, partial [Puia sp.]|nr:hypothetical protein [Puia sp.]
GCFRYQRKYRPAEIATPVATSVITTVFRRSGWYTALGGRKISWAIPDMDDISKQTMSSGRAIRFLTPKLKGKSYANQ